ncbi:MAG: hypothetical protein KKC46_11250 [Proteobacteria bacterium]|nr:hypothetical protein [Pseudomonadota bacterium]
MCFKTFRDRFLLIFAVLFSFLTAGVSPAGAADQLLVNRSFEELPLGTGWYFSDGAGADHIKTEDSGISPYSGNYMWHAGNTFESTVSQGHQP